MKQQLKKFFAATLGLHKTMRDGHKALMDDCEKDSQDYATHKALMDKHSAIMDSAEECMSACDKTSKAAGMDELEPLPAGLSRVTPDVPGVRAVPRAGQPAPASGTNADPIFQQIFGRNEGA